MDGTVDGRYLRRRLNDENHGSSCSSQNAYAGSQSTAQMATSQFGEDEVSSGDIESPNHTGLGANYDDEDGQGRVDDSRVDDNDVGNTSTIPSGSIVGEGSCVERLISRQSSERMEKGGRKSWETTQTAKMQCPKWTVSHLLRLSNMNMKKVMGYYRVLKVANNLNDEELRSFLEEQLVREKAGLSETTITNRLKTEPYVSATTNQPAGCSICMGEYKEQEEIASLYYCSHVYHADCIKKWLPNNNLCPMCRALAIIPEEYPSWHGDVRLHQAFFVHLHYAI